MSIVDAHQFRYSQANQPLQVAQQVHAHCKKSLELVNLIIELVISVASGDRFLAVNFPYISEIATKHITPSNVQHS